MATEWEGIRCKSFTLPGVNGGEVVISETIDRQAIEISVRQNGPPHIADALTVRLTAEQFDALCGMNSAYDGLEVKKPGLQVVKQEADEG